MANIPLKSIKFPDLADTYTVPSNAGELPYNKSATYPDDTVGKALQDKPDADGTIANAEQLTSNIYEEDNIPYNFRTSGGSIDIGDRETDMLVGGSVAWNQLLQDFSTTHWTTSVTPSVTITDGEVYVQPASTWNGTQMANVSVIAGHKYFISVVGRLETSGTNVDIGDGLLGTMTVGTLNTTTNKTIATIATAAATQTSNFNLANRLGVANYYMSKPQLIDLTAMFGTTIADYIYSLEQANAGAGAAWFRKLFPKPYYAYNAGELMSVNAVSHDMVGFNAWDEEWEVGTIKWETGAKETSSSAIRSKNYIPAIENTVYHIECDGNNANVFYYDADKNCIGKNYVAGSGNGNFTTPSGTAFLMFTPYASYGTTYKNDICINLSWDGERDGEYEPYVKHSYALDSDLVLRGIPKLDNGNLYYDGDTYESDGTVTRKYGIVDLGTVTWTKQSTSSDKYRFRTISLANTIKDNIASNGIANMVCSKYVTVSGNATWQGDSVGINSYTTAYGNEVCVYDPSYSDAAAFKTAMDGVYLVYELATPTTESADPYTNPQIVNDFGTEEYVDYAVSQSTRDVAIPVGHQTQYMANLKAKLEMAPNSPEGAGDYIVRQTNGENEYVTLASNATIQDIIARLEALENAES